MPSLKSGNGASFDFNGQQIVAKPSFDFNALIKSSDDTLALVTCSNYVYSPFGNLTERSNFRKTALRNFQTVEKSKKDEAGFTITQFAFASKESQLLIQFDNDSEASRHSYVVNGEIKDTQIVLVNNVRVGMDIDQFCSAFFSSYSKNAFDKINVIIFESCVTDIIHAYTFENKKLTSIRFVKM